MKLQLENLWHCFHFLSVNFLLLSTFLWGYKDFKIGKGRYKPMQILFLFLQGSTKWYPGLVGLEQTPGNFLEGRMSCSPHWLLQWCLLLHPAAGAGVRSQRTCWGNCSGPLNSRDGCACHFSVLQGNS